MKISTSINHGNENLVRIGIHRPGPFGAVGRDSYTKASKQTKDFHALNTIVIPRYFP